MDVKVATAITADCFCSSPIEGGPGSNAPNAGRDAPMTHRGRRQESVRDDFMGVRLRNQSHGSNSKCRNCSHPCTRSEGWIQSFWFSAEMSGKFAEGKIPPLVGDFQGIRTDQPMPSMKS